MGSRITIHRPTRLRYEKRPKALKPKTGPRRAEFYADDVTWAAPGPITATHVATPEGMRTINSDGTLGPVEEGVEAPESGGGPQDDHRHTFAQDRNVTVRVRNSNRTLIRPFEGPVMVPGEGVTVTNMDPNDTVRVVLTNAEGEEPPFPEQYHYIYANGLPLWRVHNLTGEQDAAHIIDNDFTNRWDIQWMHPSGSGVVPVHVEHVEKSALEDEEGASITIANIHRLMHPGAEGPLSYQERQDILHSDRGIHLSNDATDEELVEAQNTPLPGPHQNAHGMVARTTHEVAARTVAQGAEMSKAHIAANPPWRLNFKKRLKAFRHWQEWETVKTEGGNTRYVQRGPLTFRDGSPWITVVYIGLYAWLVVFPGMNLLQILNQ